MSVFQRLQHHINPSVEMLGTIHQQLNQIKEMILATAQDLSTEVAALKQAVTDLQSATSAEITRVEATIAALKAQIAAGSVSPTDLDPILADLQTTVTNLQALTGQVNAEDPATPPAAAAPAAGA